MMSRLFIAFLALTAPLCAQPLTVTGGIQTWESLPGKTVTLDGHSELHVTGKALPPVGSQIVLKSPEAWLFLEKMRPSQVMTQVLPRVRVSDGSPAIPNVNVRVAEYAMGSVVIAQPPSYAGMKIFNQPLFRGRSMDLNLYTFYNEANLGKMTGTIASFKLKRGYMATLAQQADGGGRSRVYIAQDGDLNVSALPAELKNSVQYVRVFPWQWVGKKGWCGGDPEYQVDPLWWYNWGDNSISFPNIEFVPMKWDETPSNFLNINSKQNSTHLLAYNEPNGKDQADMSPDLAIEEWPKLLQSGLRLGSPAPNDGGAGWLADFMGKADAKNLRVDFVAVHFYRCGQSAQQLHDWLKGIHDRTGRPIWITEWNNGANWTTCPDPTPEQNARVIKSWLDMFESTPWIERYSVYNWVEDCRAMTLGPKITPAGEVYRDHVSGIAYRQEVPGGTTANARYEFQGDARDVTGNGNDAMSVGVPTFGPGKDGGNAVKLDGTHDYLQLPAGIASSAEWTFATWVNWKGGADSQRIFDLGDGTGQYLFLSPQVGGKMRFAMTTKGKTAEQSLETAALKPGVWTHVALTVSGTTAKIFVNGSLAATKTDLTITPDRVKAQFNFLGKSQSPDPFFGGQLQDVVFAGKALSDSEIADLSKGGQLPSFLEAAQPEPLHGMTGVGTWGTAAEFKDIKVTQGDKVLFTMDAAKNLEAWKTERGHWEVADGVLRQSSEAGNTRALIGDASWSNYTLTLKARKLSGGEGFLIFFATPDMDMRSWWNLGGWANTQHALQSPDVESERIPGSIETGRWYDIKVELKGPVVRAYLDGKLLQQAGG